MLTEVEEKLRQNVDGKKTIGRELVVSKTHNDEKNGKNAEAHQLDSLSADSINSRDGNPVSRNSTSEHNNDVTNSGVVQVLVDVVGILGRVTNDLENGTVVQRKTIKGHVESEP